MRVAVTGTPGTGKTTATERLDTDPDSDYDTDPDSDYDTDLDIVHLNDVVEDEELYTEVDEARDSKVADLEAVRDWLDGRTDVLVESHLAHLLEADRVVVLRCAPGELERRLIERGEPSEKAKENAESEALDVILSESVRIHGEGNVYEIDATDRNPDEVAAEIAAAIAGDRDPSAGDVDFTDYL